MSTDTLFERYTVASHELKARSRERVLIQMSKRSSYIGAVILGSAAMFEFTQNEPKTAALIGLGSLLYAGLGKVSSHCEHVVESKREAALVKLQDVVQEISGN